MTTVSVLCVTYNRQHLIPFIIHQFKNQTYPNHLMELIIYDDSDNEIFIDNFENIRYIYDSERKPLGKKRNILNSLANGDIIIWFDDDDYYFPDRISKTVMKLINSPLEIVGCNYTLIYDSFKTKKIYKFKHKNNYTQNNILAYKNSYLLSHKYIDEDMYHEEKHFTNNYTTDAVMMDGKYLCLHIAHKDNTVSKNRFISRSFKTNLKFTQIVNDQYIHRVISEMNRDHLDTKIILLSSNIMNYEILNVKSITNFN